MAVHSLHCSFSTACWHLPPSAPAASLKQLLAFLLRHPARCSDGSCSLRRGAEEGQLDPEGLALGRTGLGLCTCQSAQAKHHLLRGDCCRGGSKDKDCFSEPEMQRDWHVFIYCFISAGLLRKKEALVQNHISVNYRCAHLIRKANGELWPNNLKILWAVEKETTPKVRYQAALPRSLCHGAQERGEESNQTRWAFSCLWKKFLPDMKATATADGRRCLSDDCISCGSRCPRETADNYTFCFLFHVWQPDAACACLCACVCIHVYLYIISDLSLR